MDAGYASVAYRQTAEIVRGALQIESRYGGLASAIEERFGVEVLNICSDTFVTGPSRRKRPRLWVWLRTYEAARSFRDEVGNFDSVKQQAVLSMAQATAPAARRTLGSRFAEPSFGSPGTLVVFTSFERPALDEAFLTITDKQLDLLRESVGNPDLWLIKSLFTRVVFFVHTDEQVRKYADGEERQGWEDAFWDLVKPYDEFNFLTRERFHIEVDSQETFERDYKGNWLWYSR